MNIAHSSAVLCHLCSVNMVKTMAVIKFMKKVPIGKTTGTIPSNVCF